MCLYLRVHLSVLTNLKIQDRTATAVNKSAVKLKLSIHLIDFSDVHCLSLNLNYLLLLLSIYHSHTLWVTHNQQSLNKNEMKSCGLVQPFSCFCV